jgi:hypothetical protein
MLDVDQKPLEWLDEGLKQKIIDEEKKKQDNLLKMDKFLKAWAKAKVSESFVMSATAYYCRRREFMIEP